MTKRWHYYIAAAAAAWGIWKMSKPRGIRNNNPGNLRKSADRWQGLAVIQSDPAFFTFASPVWGIRALAKTLLTYRNKYGLESVNQIIDRWAPPNENDTGAYINSVAQKMGVSIYSPLRFAAPGSVYESADELTELVKAIIYHENGRQPYSNSLIADAVRRAWA